VKPRPEAVCGSIHELLIAKFGLKLKKAGKTTRPFSNDLNQISFFFLFFLKILFYFYTLQYCISFAKYRNESATGIPTFPILNPPPSSLPYPPSNFL